MRLERMKDPAYEEERRAPESGATRKEKLDEKSVLGTKPNGVGFKSKIVAAQTAP